MALTNTRAFVLLGYLLSDALFSSRKVYYEYVLKV